VPSPIIRQTLINDAPEKPMLSACFQTRGNHVQHLLVHLKRAPVEIRRSELGLFHDDLRLQA